MRTSSRRGRVLLAALALHALCACQARPRPPLRVLVASAPLGLDPHLQDEDVTCGVLGNAFEGLTGFDADMHLQPVLAERWESPDDLTWRFHLRPGVRFHDGRPLQATDVVASLERARRHPRTQVAGRLVAVRGVRALGDDTVEVTTARPYPLLLNKLAFVAVVPRDAPGEIRVPVGTGPYRIEPPPRPGDPIVLARFDGYWGGPAAEPRLLLLPVESGPERLRRLVAGEADVATRLPDDTDDRDAAPAGVRIEWRPTLSVVHLGLRVDRPPFSDVRVRRAVSVALDRAAIVQGLLRGRGQVASQLVSPHVFGFAPDLRPTARDLARARRLLAEAGHAAGLAVELEHSGGARIVAQIRDQLAEAGVRVSLVPRPWPELYPRLVSGKARFFFAGLACSSGDASDMLDDGLHKRDPARGYGEANFTGYGSPALDAVIEQSGELLQLERRRRLLQQALRLAEQDLPLVALWARPEVYGVREGVEWRPREDGRPYGRDMRRR